MPVATNSKSKYSRRNVGTIYRSKLDGQSDYLQFKLEDGETLTFNNGDKLQVETRDYRKKNIEKGLREGRLAPDLAEKLSANVNKMPEFVRAEVVQLIKN